MSADRQTSAWTGMQDAQDPLGLYARTYRAKVVAQTDDMDYVDVRPTDARLPDMRKIPLRHGIPGLRVQVQLGSFLLVGWDDGRPDRPFAALWNRDTHVVQASLLADKIKFGSRSAHEAFVLGTSYRSAEDTLLSGLRSAFTMLASASSSGPLGSLQPGMQKAIASLSQFITAASSASGYLSPKVFGE